MKNLWFECSESQCKKFENGASYDEILKHQNRCLYQYFVCPFSCFERDPEKEFSQEIIQGFELESHIEQCPMYEMECEKCGLTVMRSKMDQHNCIRDIKHELEQTELETAQLKEKYGLNTTVKCPSGHLLMLTRGRTLTYPRHTQTNCDKCGERKLENHEINYHCKTCKYDICRQCFLVEAGIIRNEMQVAVHECTLKRF